VAQDKSTSLFNGFYLTDFTDVHRK